MKPSLSSVANTEALAQIHSGKVRTESGYCEIPTSVFVARIDVNMGMHSLVEQLELYLKKGATFELLKPAGKTYSALALRSFESVWVKESDLALIRKLAEDTILGKPDPTAQASGEPPKPALPTESRMTALRQSAINVVEDLFDNPSPENINRSVKVVGSFVYVLMKDPNAYLFLAKLSSHDPYTLQHSVGTAVNCIILGKKIGITREDDLEELGLAGLLHDIGKVKVKKEIINKEGPLDEVEWEEMRQHSREGYEIIKNHPAVTERTKRAILEHHEDKQGTGYPSGLKEGDLDMFSKIVCISDIFNALTTNRSYSKARTPFEAFALMRDKMQHKIDDKLFKSLVMIYGGQVA